MYVFCDYFNREKVPNIPVSLEFSRFHGSRFNGTFRSRETLQEQEQEQVNKWRTGDQRV